MNEMTTSVGKHSELSDSRLNLSPHSLQFYRLLLAVRESNEYQTQKSLSALLRKGMPGELNDVVQEWRFCMVRLLTLMSFMMRGKGIGNRYLEQLGSEYLRKIEAADSVAVCKKLLVEIVKTYTAMGKGELEKYSALVQHIVTETEMDLTKPLTLTYFSSQLNVNSSYLSNLFRHETGTTITEYVTGKRISHAANLLRFTREPVKTVAKMVGISDVQYFSRVFKKRMGVTPTQYRARPF